MFENWNCNVAINASSLANRIRVNPFMVGLLMLLLAAVHFSLEFPVCNSTTYPTVCSNIVQPTCTFDKLFLDLVDGSIDKIKEGTTQTCTTDCLKQHKDAYDCLLKDESPTSTALAKSCINSWNNHCGSIDGKLCRIATYNYWQSKGHNNYTKIKEDILADVNDGFECTECEKQSLGYYLKFELYQVKFGLGPALGPHRWNLTADLCGSTFLDSFSVNGDAFSGLKENVTTTSEPVAKTASGSNSINNMFLILTVLVLT